MTAADLERIEKELNLILPRSYREFVRSGAFGEGDKGTQDFTGVADEVIRMTKDLRANGFFGAEWPDHFLAIGDDGAGDYYFTDVHNDRPAVFLADHELTTNQNRLVFNKRSQYGTFAEFWQLIQQTNKAADRSMKKRWWQLLIRPIKFI